MRMTRQDFGRATEARFLLDAQRHGLLVSRPWDSVPGYDFICDNGRRLFRVQVKGARLSKTPPSQPSRGATYRINIDRRRRRGRFPKRARFDVVAVWLDADLKWVFLPRPARKIRHLYITPAGKHTRHSWEIFARR